MAGPGGAGGPPQGQVLCVSSSTSMGYWGTLVQVAPRDKQNTINTLALVSDEVKESPGRPQAEFGVLHNE